MKSQQYAFFDHIPMEAAFSVQDNLFELAFWLCIWAHFNHRPPKPWQLVLLLVVAVVWSGVLEVMPWLWSVIDTGHWLSSTDAAIFNRLNFTWVVYLMTYLSLLGRYILAERHWRTVFRAFAVLISFVSIGTFTLFHTVVIGGGLFEARYARDEMVMSLLRNDAPVEVIEKVCQDMEFWCGISADPKSLHSDEPEVQDALDNLVSWQMFELRDQPRVTKQIQHYLTPSKFHLGVFQTISGYIDRRGEQWIFIFDKKGFDRTTARFVTYASLLIAAAHLVWILGGMTLVYLHESGRIHKYAMRGKLAERAMVPKPGRASVSAADTGVATTPDQAKPSEA
jgi:hypothetical protein